MCSELLLVTLLLAADPGSPVQTTRLESLGVASEENNDCIRFAVNLIDTDFLTLGDGKNGHCRLHMKLSIGGDISTAATTTLDVPKEECDLSKMLHSLMAQKG